MLLPSFSLKFYTILNLSVWRGKFLQRSCRQVFDIANTDLLAGAITMNELRCYHKEKKKDRIRFLIDKFPSWFRYSSHYFFSSSFYPLSYEYLLHLAKYFKWNIKKGKYYQFLFRFVVFLIVDILINKNLIANSLYFAKLLFDWEKGRKNKTTFKCEYIKLSMNWFNFWHLSFLLAKETNMLSKKEKTNTVFALVATVKNWYKRVSILNLLRAFPVFHVRWNSNV